MSSWLEGNVIILNSRREVESFLKGIEESENQEPFEFKGESISESDMKRSEEKLKKILSRLDD